MQFAEYSQTLTSDNVFISVHYSILASIRVFIRAHLCITSRYKKSSIQIHYYHPIHTNHHLLIVPTHRGGK